MDMNINLSNDLNTNETINNHIENLIQNEFNSSNYDATMNYSLNQLTQFINLTNQDCLINSNLNESNSLLTVDTCQNDLEQNLANDSIERYSNSFEKAFETTNQIMNSKQSNIDNEFTFSFLSDEVLSSSMSPEQTKIELENKTDIKLQTNRFNYKCKYCISYSTKFKVHIIEHMQLNHNVYLMQCPELKCSKRFKDEWKLKRHLVSNREHQPLNEYKNLNDVMKPHVDVSPQKSGFPCPLCQLDQNNNLTLLNDLQSINDKKLENNLYFERFDDLKEHLLNKHTNLDINSYFICKICGQVFQNRYKLSCHSFNVHSGKRKSRKKQLTLQQNKMPDIKLNNNESIIDYHIKNIIDSVAIGIDSNNVPEANSYLNIQQLKINCVVCTKKFKRIRDINSHIKIMHKTLSDTEKQQQDAILESHKKLLKLNKKNIIKNQLITTNLLNHQNENKNIKVCFVCNKVFKETVPTNGSTNTPNKTFIRHMQIQHGLNQKGEPLIECPVCEKNFFNRQQMERHMHTHEVWIDIKSNNLINNSSVYLSDSFSFEQRNAELSSVDNIETSDFRHKHSILYCHECIECKTYFKSIKVLTKHKHDVHHLRPVYKCANTSECNEEFETVASFLEHSKLHPQKNIICARCKIKFNNKNSLRHHMKNIHYNRKLSTVVVKKTANQPQTIRNLSNKISSTSYSMNVNNQVVIKELSSSPSPNLAQTEQTSFCCPTCKKVFTSRNSLHNHLATHNTNELRLFSCNTCGHSFKTRKDLSRHASLHDASKHKTCQDCGMTFKTSFHLKRHSLTRHSNVRPFKCISCEMTFARKDKLKQHEAKHINHPLYQCSQCSKGFYRKEHLKDHEISKHSKQYPFSCEHCSKGFVHAKDLHRHIRVRHLGIAENNTVVKSTTKNVSTKPKVKKSNLKLNISTNLPVTMTSCASLSSNDFKSKKISSILKSNLLTGVGSSPSLQTFENNSNSNNSGNNSKQTMSQLLNEPNQQQTMPILSTEKQIITNQLINQQQPPQQQQQFNIFINSNDSGFLILKNDFQPIHIIKEKINQINNQTIEPVQKFNASFVNKTVPVAKLNTQSQQFLKSFKCSTCAKDFFYENHLRKHILSKHTVTPLFACSYCNQGFSTKSTAKSHVENSHVSYSCPVCVKSFKTRSHCTRHISSFHNTNDSTDPNIKPKKELNVDVKLIDSSMANMNMLNLISIDKTNGKIVNSNASNPIVYDSNQQNQINVITIKDLSRDKEKFIINDHSFISNFNTSDNFNIDNNETLNTYFTNSQQDIKTNSGPLMASNKYLTNDRNQQFFNQNATAATTYNSNLNFNIKLQQRSVQYESAIENNTNNGNDLISIDTIRYHI